MSVVSMLSVTISVTHCFSLIRSAEEVLLTGSYVAILAVMQFEETVYSQVLISKVLSTISSLFSA